MVKDWDFKLGDLPLVSPDGGTAIKLGAALNEPARPSEVGSIVIASFHGGIGRGFADGILRYSSSVDADLSIPGEFGPRFSIVTVGSAFAGSCVATRPTFGYGNGGQGRVYVIAGQTLRTFDPGNPGAGLATPTQAGDAFPADSEYSGSTFQYNSELVFGGIKNSATERGKPAFHAVADLGGATTVTREDTLAISYGASTRGRCFWVDIDTGLRWAPMVNGATFNGAAPFVKFPATGNGQELGHPRVTWLSMLGSALLIFKADGVIIGANEQGLLREAGRLPPGGLDYHFGRRAAAFHDGMLISGNMGLWSFDLRTLTLRPASPNYIQGVPDARLRGTVSAVGAAGPYAYAAVRQGSTPTSTGFEIVRYQDRMSVHDLIPETSDNEVITDFLPYYDTGTGQTLLYYLVWNESTNNVTVKYRPLRLPSDYGSGLTVAATNSVTIPVLSGPQPAANMTKLFAQVRGYFDKGSGASAQLAFSDWMIDSAEVSLASVTATGPFSRSFTASPSSRLLGREITAGTVVITNAAYDTALHMPLTIDFTWAPGFDDAIYARALVSSEVLGNAGGIRRRAPTAAAIVLLALRNTVTTLTFPGGGTNGANTSWTVLIEDVQIDDRPQEQNISGGAPVRIATIQMRRVA